jgi:chromosome segregation ATPase
MSAPEGKSEASSNLSDAQSAQQEAESASNQADAILDEEGDKISTTEKELNQIGNEVKDGENKGNRDEIEAAAEQTAQMQKEQYEEVQKLATLDQDLAQEEADTEEETEDISGAMEASEGMMEEAGSDMQKVLNRLQENPNSVDDEFISFLENSASEFLEGFEQINENDLKMIETVVQDVKDIEDKEERMERLERNLEAQERIEGGIVEELERDAEQLNDEEMMQQAKGDQERLEALGGAISSRVNENEDLLRRLGKEEQGLENLIQEQGNIQNKAQQGAQVAEQIEEAVDGAMESMSPGQRQSAEQVRGIAEEFRKEVKEEVKEQRDFLRDLKDNVGDTESKMSELKGMQSNLEGNMTSGSTGGSSAGSTIVWAVLILGVVIAAIAILNTQYSIL